MLSVLLQMRDKPNPDRGLSRDKRGVFLRIPVLLYDKLRRLVAAQISKGHHASVNSVVMDLIDDADEPRTP